MDMAAADPENVGTGASEPLAELVAALFCPLGADGVYGRTGLFESIVDGLSLLIASRREPGTETLEVAAGDEPDRARNLRLSQELSEPARRCLHIARNRGGNSRGDRPVRDRRRVDGGIGAVRSRPLSGSLLPDLSVGGTAGSGAATRPAVRCGVRLLPTRAFAAARRACSRFACANISPLAPPPRSPTFAIAGSIAGGNWPRNWDWTAGSHRPAIRFSAGPVR